MGQIIRSFPEAISVVAIGLGGLGGTPRLTGMSLLILSTKNPVKCDNYIMLPHKPLILKIKIDML